MALVSDEVLAKAKKKLVVLSANWAGGVCRGEVWTLEGKDDGATHSACHSWVTAAFSRHCWNGRTHNWTTPYTEKSQDFLVLSCHSKKRSKNVCSEEAHEAIILWLASPESPFSKYILNRDDEDSLKNGGVVILCGPSGASCAEAMWICKLLRYGIEGAKALDVWHTLYKGGVHPLLAIYVATFIRSVKGADFAYTGAEGHSCVFFGTENPDKVLPDLLKAEPKPFAKETRSVFVTSQHAAPYPMYYQEKKLEGFCKPIEKPDGWGGSVKGQGVSPNDLVARVLEWQEELGGAKKRVRKPRLPTKETVYLDLDL